MDEGTLAPLEQALMDKTPDLRLPWEAIEFEQAALTGFGSPRACYLVEDSRGIIIAMFEDLAMAQ